MATGDFVGHLQVGDAQLLDNGVARRLHAGEVVGENGLQTLLEGGEDRLVRLASAGGGVDGAHTGGEVGDGVEGSAARLRVLRAVVESEALVPVVSRASRGGVGVARLDLLDGGVQLVDDVQGHDVVAGALRRGRGLSGAGGCGTNREMLARTLRGV
eukprot:2885386-Pyramimonas_sp.AAC.5